MTLLIDTHVFVWIATGDRRLTKRVIEAVMNPEQEVFVSVVSRWEVALKQQRHRDFRLPRPFGRLMEQMTFVTRDPRNRRYPVPTLW
jgi:PIN domain nuclease of toxin-antitoxin system